MAAAERLSGAPNIAALRGGPAFFTTAELVEGLNGMVDPPFQRTVLVKGSLVKGRRRRGEVIATEVAKEYENKVAMPTEESLSSGCFSCFMTREMRILMGSAEYFFDTVNSEDCCWCIKDGSLSRTETRLRMLTLQNESRTSLSAHAAFIRQLMTNLDGMSAGNGDGGETITRDEFIQAILAATLSYEQKAIGDISVELQKNLTFDDF